LPPVGGRGGGQGAPPAQSEASLPSTAPNDLWHPVPSTPREAFAVEDVVFVCALHRRQVTRGEELSVVHRLRPWLAVIPVDLVPGVAGGDNGVLMSMSIHGFRNDGHHQNAEGPP
jgi:hypothetical protein